MSKFTYLFDVTNIKNVVFVALHWKYCDFKHQNCATLKTLKLMTSRWKMTSQWRHRCDFFELKEIGDGRWHIQVTSGRCCSKCCCCEQSNTNMTTHHKSTSSSTNKQTAHAHIQSHQLTLGILTPDSGAPISRPASASIRRVIVLLVGGPSL